MEASLENECALMLKYQRLVVRFEFFIFRASANDEFRIMVVMRPKYSLGGTPLLLS